jgi:hypothetical protein
MWSLLINIKKFLFSGWTAFHLKKLIIATVVFVPSVVFYYKMGFLLDISQLKEIIAYFFGNGGGNSTAPTSLNFTKIPLPKGSVSLLESKGNNDIISLLQGSKNFTSAAPAPEVVDKVSLGNTLPESTSKEVIGTTVILLAGVYLVAYIIKG